MIFHQYIIRCIHLSTSQNIGYIKLSNQKRFSQHSGTGGFWQIFSYINGYFFIAILPNHIGINIDSLRKKLQENVRSLLKYVLLNLV